MDKNGFAGARPHEIDESAQQASDREFRELALDAPRRSRVAHLAALEIADREAAQAVAKAALLDDLLTNDVTLRSWADFKEWRVELDQSHG